MADLPGSKERLKAAGQSASQQSNAKAGAARTPCPSANAPTPDNYDSERNVVCKAVCTCNSAAPIGAAGQKLKQICVSSALTALDAATGYKTTIKAEVSYNMTPPPPPKPLMTKSNKLRPFPVGVLGFHLEDLVPGFKPRKGMVRRPDVVVTRDPAKPPTQDNIKAIFEIKFPPEKDDPVQLEAYQTIAGNADVVPLSPAKCGCGRAEPKQIPVPVPQTAPERQKTPVSSGPGGLEAALLVLGLAALILDDAVGGEADDVLIPAVIQRLGEAF